MTLRSHRRATLPLPTGSRAFPFLGLVSLGAKLQLTEPSDSVPIFYGTSSLFDTCSLARHLWLVGFCEPTL